MEDLQEQLTRLKSMLEEGLITEEEYDTLKNQFFSEALDKKESDEEMEESISLSDQLIPEVDSSESEENVDNDSFSDGQQKSVEVLYPKEQIDTVSQTDTNTFVETREAKEDKKVKKILLWFGIFLASYLLVVALPKIDNAKMSDEDLAYLVLKNAIDEDVEDGTVDKKTAKQALKESKDDLKENKEDMSPFIQSVLDAIDLLKDEGLTNDELKNYKYDTLRHIDGDPYNIIRQELCDMDDEDGNLKVNITSGGTNDQTEIIDRMNVIDEDSDTIASKTFSYDVTDYNKD